MSYVARVELLNWGPYRGEHAVDLTPEVYAVVGRRDTDEESSNWAGKTFWLGAIRFALFGERPEGCRLEDDWITRGEDEGRVRVVMSDGLASQRRRRRGSSTEVEVQRPGQSAAKGRHAEDVLDDYLAVSGKDFAAGPWVGQRDVARLVLATPGDRAQLVEGWLDVTKLREAERVVTAKAAQSREQCDRLGEEVARLDAEIDAIDAQPGSDPAQLRKQAQAARRDYDKLDAELQRAQEAQGAADAYAREVARRARLEQAAAALQQLLDDYDADPGADPAALQEAARRALNAADAARDEAVRLRALVKGEGFDGVCPVTCDACPVAGDVQQKGREMGEQSRQAAQLARTARDKATTADGLAREQQARRQARADTESKLNAARAELAAEPAPAPPPSLEVDAAQLRADRDRARTMESDLIRTAAQADAFAKRRTDLVQLAADRATERDEADADARTWTQAAGVLRGARREVCEQAVVAIEADANAGLAQAGADLSVRFSWEREGQGMASHCNRCGAGFPPGKTARRCVKCGADRQAKTIEALELVLSARSGAAEDLAGLFAQLAAASWLRSRRGSPVGFVVVDEPFAHLDPANARRLGAQLHRALTGRLRFEQAFVVAHTAAVTEAMPRRIVVRAGQGGSRLEVE